MHLEGHVHLEGLLALHFEVDWHADQLDGQAFDLDGVVHTEENSLLPGPVGAVAHLDGRQQHLARGALEGTIGLGDALSALVAPLVAAALVVTFFSGLLPFLPHLLALSHSFFAAQFL